MICGNILKPAVQINQKKSNQRVAAFSASCKYIKLAIVTDYEYYLHETSMNVLAGISGLKEKIYDMVNKMEFVIVNNTQTSYGISPIGLRLQLTGLATYTTSNDPFNFTGSILTVNNKTSITIDGDAVLAEFTNKINQGLIFPSSVIRNQSHLLTGRAMGFTDGTLGGTQRQFGKANPATICNNPSSATSVNTIKELVQQQPSSYNNALNNSISYTDVWRTMLHEMGHVLGAVSDLALSTAPDYCSPFTYSIMCPVPGKLPYFNQKSVNEINNHLNSYCSCSTDPTSVQFNNPYCLEKNIAKPAYSNNFTLKLNGNNILSTPLFVNGLTKTLDIPIDPNIPTINSTFSSTNSLVTITKINNNKATFKINSTPSFTLNVNSQNACSFSQWGIPIVYSPSGAKLGFNVYPNPVNDIINIDNQNNTIELTETSTFKKMILFSENGNFVQEFLNFENNKIATKNIKNGIYYLHLINNDGRVERKRIIINH